MKLKHGKKTGLKYFNINDIRSWKPCYDPRKYLNENFRGNAITILQDERVPFVDRLWVVLRNEIVSDKVMRLFAVWSYRQTLTFIKNPDPRSLKAAEVAEKFAKGQATTQELESAESAAWSAAWSVAESAAWSAAWSAARSAARSAESAAQSAARSAESAAWSAAWSAWSAAESAARSAQRDKLIEMILIESKERIKK
jgi:hypothetical protein